LFFGGTFWDGRATGWKLGNPAADQAQGPFLNPVEHNNLDAAAVLKQIAKSKYARLWRSVWGEPVSYGTPEEVELNYNRVGLSIAAYEASAEVNAYTSKYDYWLANQATLTAQEEEGRLLFFGDAQCAACHVEPDFTDFTYDNLGIPPNLDNPFYKMDQVFLDNGEPINRLGPNWIDYGLEEFLLSLANGNAWRNLPYTTEPLKSMTSGEILALVPDNRGKHKVSTLRNVDMRPGNGFTKAYGHNGYFKSLEEIVHFYNTRDDGTWPAPEVMENVNTSELGNLGLTAGQEAAIVAFLKTLTDGYVPAAAPAAPLAGSGLALSVTGPNPFNPATHFAYTLTEAADVRLEVYNVLGQKVATLANGRHAPGTYQAEFSATNLPSGIYLLLLQNGREKVTAKVTLIK
jgi:cytochrome c peroxidase